MRISQYLAWGGAFAVLAAFGSPSHAAWNNVFQVCCNSCGTSPTPVVAAYSDPCAPACAPPPTTTCTTRYVQRSYYQPVVSYKATTYSEPVTSYRTSYYYEPVTSYRRSCYYDPCTCRYQSVTTPTTCYRLRSQCCPVTSYLQRTCMTPVTSYQQSFYYEPVTSCCTTTTGGAVASPPAGASVVPGISETRQPSDALPAPPPGTAESHGIGAPGTEIRRSERSPAIGSPPPMAPADGASRRPIPTPPTRFDRIASRGNPNLEGKVVDASRAPRSGVKILLVSADSRSVQQTVTADQNGKFAAEVGSGGWLLYTHDERGRPVFSRRVEVPSDRGVSMTLVQR
jgi:hypothetical protein